MTTNTFGMRVSLWVAAGCALAAAGCQTAPTAPDRATVSAALGQRVGHGVPGSVSPGDFTLPPGASLDDGITEDEAVAVALYNNAAFQELLADLGLTRGDLIQAGLLPNPEFLVYFPVTDKPVRYLFDFALESLWLRPVRVRGAAGEAERTAQRLTQAGLDLMRDTRQAYADAVLARERVRIAAESVKLRGQIAKLAESRLEFGDASEQETATARIDSLQAEQDATRVGYDVPVLEERLRNLMGIGPLRGSAAARPGGPAGLPDVRRGRAQRGGDGDPPGRARRRAGRRRRAGPLALRAVRLGAAVGPGRRDRRPAHRARTRPRATGDAADFQPEPGQHRPRGGRTRARGEESAHGRAPDHPWTCSGRACSTGRRARSGTCS